VETFVQTGGRPLGMKFDAGGSLIVADAFRGLLSVSQERKVTVLADGVNGPVLNCAPLGFLCSDTDRGTTLLAFS
jgi:hypothetical protein